MCCFAQPVSHVGKTRIFGRLSGKGSQYVAYQMEYQSAEPNAMLLPLPTPLGDEQAVRFLDLSHQERLFSKLRKGFPAPAPSTGAIATDSRSEPAALPKLTVHKVGDFIASFVPSVDDFDRLDARFVIPKATWLHFPQYAQYGFAVFQLAELAGRPHPMAFEFKTQLQEQLFFPTVHIHDGRVHETEEFDHDLYLQHAGYDRGQHYDLQRSSGPAESFMQTDDTAGLIQPGLSVYRTSLTGRLLNRDTFYAAAGDPLKVTQRRGLPSTLAAAGLTAAGLTVGGMSWMIARRQKLAAHPIDR